MNLTLSGSRLAAFGGLYFGLGTALGLGLAGLVNILNTTDIGGHICNYKVNRCFIYGFFQHS